MKAAVRGARPSVQRCTQEEASGAVVSVSERERPDPGSRLQAARTVSPERRASGTLAKFRGRSRAARLIQDFYLTNLTHSTYAESSDFS